MKKIIFLALSAAALLCATPAFADDTSGYKSLTDQATVDYKTTLARCNDHAGNATKICREEARLARAKADADAVAQHRNTPRDMGKAHAAVANAEYDLAKAKCAERSGSDRSSCLRDAKSARMAALSDAKSGARSAAIQSAGSANTSGASGSGASAGGAARSGEMQAQAGSATVMEDCDRMGATDKAACVARHSSGKAKNVIADTVITTKVKADLVKEPDLKAMDVHVETVNGVVMLSGFVPSQTQANKAVELARGVEGVHDVKSALKVTK